MPRSTSRHLLTLVAALTLWAAAPQAAQADTGLFSIRAGAIGLEDGGERSWRPRLRADLAFELAGPLQAGPWFVVSAEEFPLQNPGFGAGLLVAVRPEIPGIGLVPSFEATAGRLQLPTSQGRADVWVTGLSVGLGVRVAPNVLVEGQVGRDWYHGLGGDMSLGETAWTATLGLGVEIP